MEALEQRLLDVGMAGRGGVEAGPQVGAGRERAPVAGQHDRADRVVAGGVAQRGQQLVPEPVVDGVHGLRAVEDDRGHRAAALDLNAHAKHRSVGPWATGVAPRLRVARVLMRNLPLRVIEL